MYSVVRHYTPVPYCLACHKYYHTVGRTQYHLKRTPACLLRTAHVLRPLTWPEVQDAEAEDRRRQKADAPAEPAVRMHGPRLPTYGEALGDLTDDSVTPGRLQRQYRPSVQTLRWVQDFIDGASTEGCRNEATEFWLSRPVTSVEPPVSPSL